MTQCQGSALTSLGSYYIFNLYGASLKKGDYDAHGDITCSPSLISLKNKISG